MLNGASIAALGMTATLTLPAAAGPPAVIFVDDDAPLGGDGTSWRSAYRHVQDALLAADRLAGPVELRLGQGIYQPDLDEAGLVVPGDRDAAFTLQMQRALLGGFAGTGAADPDARDVVAFPTIITGDLLGDDGSTGTGDNARHLVLVVSDAQVTIDGIHLTAAHADADAPEDDGAAVRSQGGELHLVDCIISDCFASDGGAVASTTVSTVTVAGCTFAGNTSDGGAAALDSNFSTLSVTNCSFTDNVGAYAGGISVFFGSVVVEDSSFAGNVATVNGDAAAAIGVFTNGSALIRDCSFVDHEHTGDGVIRFDNVPEATVEGCSIVGTVGRAIGAGDMDQAGDVLTILDCHIEGGSDAFGTVRLRDVLDFTISGCTFVDNTASTGGGVILDGSAGAIRDSVFVGNRTTAAHDPPIIYGAGGALHVTYESEVLVERCRFHSNEATSLGGAIHVWQDSDMDVRNCLFTGNVAGAGGGAISQRSGSGLSIDFCAFVGNVAETGTVGGVLAEGFVAPRHCIFWDNADPTGINAGSQTDAFLGFGYSCVQGYEGEVVSIVTDDPMFIDVDGPDDLIGTTDDSATIAADSPCRDAGSVGWDPLPGETDLDGDPRRVFCTVDIGADEVTAVGTDCNGNANPDTCDLIDGTSGDCNGNGIPDDCDIAGGFSNDCNGNAIPDECDGAAPVYALDDGDGDELLLVDGIDVIWLNAYQVTPGNEWLGAVSTVWGPFVTPGTPATLLVYTDPHRRRRSGRRPARAATGDRGDTDRV